MKVKGGVDINGREAPATSRPVSRRLTILLRKRRARTINPHIRHVFCWRAENFDRGRAVQGLPILTLYTRSSWDRWSVEDSCVLSP